MSSVKDDLNKGEYVIFTGTPCQVFALKSFLNKEKIGCDKLLTIDLICHGSPDIKLWCAYKNWLEKRHKKRLNTFKFRYKDARWNGYEVPPVSNANYAWILHMLSRLSYDGTAAFLLANGALGAPGVEQKIRKQLIDNNKIEAIIVLPREMFYATPISVTMWICGNNKKEKEDSIISKLFK